MLQEKARRKKYNAIHNYKPYLKQSDFHNAGLKYDERALGAGNQLGKTVAGSYEAAYHATGLYPDNWEGLRFDKATTGWVGGVTGDTIRDSTQKLLLGRIQEGTDAIGTGSIPKHCIVEIVKARGTPDLLDHIVVRHVTNGLSLIFFKSYASGREKWQAETLDWVWFDEEPPYDIYSEGRTRTNNGQKGRCVWMTFTPLLGMTDVVNQFYKAPTKVQNLTLMGINDVEHYTDDQKENIINGYEEWERDARVNGVPTLGSGKVFRYKEEDVSEEYIADVPRHWALLNGLDFGWDHPQSCVQIAWDKDNDIIHVIRGKKARETKPNDMWMMCKAWAEGIPTVWPHDGFQHDKSGKQTKELYRSAGFDMHFEQATHEEGGNGVEAGIMEMQERFATGRLKVDVGLTEFWEEFRLYHRKNGLIVKQNDDFIDALRYAIMMKRFAKSKSDMEYVYIEPHFISDMPM